MIALVLLGVLPLLFWSRTRRRIAALTAYYVLGVGVGLTAYAMSSYSVGGWSERFAVLSFNTLFLFELIMSFQAWQSEKISGERCWDLRSVATVLGIATSRPVMGVFFATSRITHWTPDQFFGPAMWIGFSINVVIMEIWLRNQVKSAEGSSL